MFVALASLQLSWTIASLNAARLRMTSEIVILAQGWNCPRQSPQLPEKI
jgi:hypothetical protein